MAKGKSKKAAGPETRTQKLTKEQVRSAFAEMDRLREKATTYNGELGAFKKGFCERTGVSVQAASIIGKLDRLGDDLKRQSVMDEVLLLFDLMGWDDQGTLFGRVETRKANSVAKDKGEEEDDPRPAFLKNNSMPLPEAEAAFTAANASAAVKAEAKARKAAGKPLPDALTSLAGGKAKPPEEPAPDAGPKLN